VGVDVHPAVHAQPARSSNSIQQRRFMLPLPGETRAGRYFFELLFEVNFFSVTVSTTPLKKLEVAEPTFCITV